MILPDSRSRRGHWLASSLVAAVFVLVATLSSCASTAPREPSFHVLRKGENLYRLGLRYGVRPTWIAKVNGIDDVTAISVGTRLRIPRSNMRPAPTPAVSAASTKRLARQEALQRGKLRFEWPIRGRLTSRFGRRHGRRHEGIDLAAARGTEIYAAEGGRVIHSGRLGDYGKVVIVRHDGNYRSVYAHARRTHVRKGQRVRKGQKLAEVGTTGKSSGPHLHFEIRHRRTAHDPILYLP